MTTLQIEIEDDIAAKLEKLEPELLSKVLRNALWDLEERATAAAYARQPDLDEPYVDPGAWSDLEIPDGRHR